MDRELGLGLTPLEPANDDRMSDLQFERTVPVQADALERALETVAAQRSELEAALRMRDESQRQLHAELEDARLLQRISAMLVSEENVDALYKKLVDAAVLIMRSDFCSMQRFDETRNELRLLAHHGFTPDGEQFWERVTSDSGSTCALTLGSLQRVVIADVPAYAAAHGPDRFAPLLSGEIMAAQTTPLLSRSGALVGAISTHWKTVHQPSERDLRMLDIVARQAADLIERNSAHQAMARELKDTRRLRDVAARMIGADGNHALFGEILDAAIDITEADAGTIQLYDDATDSLQFLATRGFGREIVSHFSHVDASSASPCGIALAAGQRVFMEFEPGAPDPDGSNKWHLDAGVRAAQSTPLTSRTGRPLGMFSTHWRERRSLSERELRFLDLLGRQAADLIERTQAEEQVREGARRKDEFLAVLAHELRNPLAPIRSGVDLLKAAQDPLVSKVRPMMERQVSHMVRLIDDLLDVSRITSNRVQLQRETVSLGSLVETALEANRDAIAAAGLSLDIQIDDPERQLSVDPTRMSQVLSNILHNAAKFTGPGGTLTVSTELSAAAGSENVEQIFRIADTGIGIQPETLATIFELFTQVRPDSSLRHGGMGIGLALARSLVELHQGTITAHSAGTGLGSTFVVRIPYAAASEETTEAARQPARELGGLRVMVVDDNQDAADAVGALLAMQGCEVRIDYLARAAIDSINDFDPHLVLLDIGMPNIDGFEACRLIRKIKGADVGIVALTGWGDQEDRRRTASAGFDDHLTKPVDFARLVAVAGQIRSGLKRAHCV